MFLSSILRKANLSVLCILFEREDKMRKHKNKLLVSAAASLAFSAMAAAASAETLIEPHLKFRKVLTVML